MGDVAMLVPVLSAFTNQYPEVKITVLTRAFFAPFFKHLPTVEVVHANVKAEHKGILGIYKLAKSLKKLQLDAVADCHNVLRSKILKFFLGGIRCIQLDKGRAEKKALTNGNIFKQLKTTHQRYADIFEKLGYPIDFSKVEFPPTAELPKSLEEILNTHVKPCIAIAPFAAHEGKMYPWDQMLQVIETLSNDYQVLLFGGGKKEVELLETTASKFKNVTSLAGKLSLSEEMDVISNCKLMLAMDSGNGHIAAILGIKVITIWGVTHPYAGFTTYNQPESHQLLPDRNKYPLIPTSVYGNKYPNDYKDVAGSILPKTIIDKVYSVLNR
jgi:ADP-heptose:LPS heptosyltransferase